MGVEEKEGMIDSMAGRRLIELGETFEAFKERQKVIREYVKIKAKGEMQWPSVMVMMAENGRTKKIPVLGTYDKKTSEAKLKQLAI